MIDDPDYEEVPQVATEKPWWQSRAIIGVMISSLAVGAGMVGVEIDAGVATELSVGLVALIGNALAWYGRVKATKVISRRQVMPGVTLNR